MHLKLFASSLVRLDLSTCAYPTDPNTCKWFRRGLSLNDNSCGVVAEGMLFVDRLIKYTAMFTASAHHIADPPL
ncbi:hypothetical protein PHMEG_00026170 [Phytophthora megakarya]|uniref:Secreted protein n=1 Tax=Phytophthora megakarya TaxID=4795 RepID=A0A225V9V4_9STRA|nr:hypothetical protein PHMEG_00026170 [Phytophthora megakarya]